ncbi:hypothetical protein SDC9_144342 [bioreactor metagenome]|uniref:HTH marR-type domain-containing protein n=2 Tax=root TaxID=1 RepID=A0A645E6K4_9ZZZZ
MRNGGGEMLLPDKDIVAITKIYRKVNLWKNEQAAPLGLTAAQVPIVILACRKSGISQNEMVDELALEKSVVAKSIGKLMEAGYITRKQNKKDKRAFDLFPTEKAQAIYPILVQQGKNCMDLLTAGLSEDEKAALSDLLEKIVQNTYTQFLLTS